MAIERQGLHEVVLAKMGLTLGQGTFCLWLYIKKIKKYTASGLSEVIGIQGL